MKDSMVPVETFWDGDASNAEKSWMRLFWRIVRRGWAGRVGGKGESKGQGVNGNWEGSSAVIRTSISLKEV